MRDKIGNVSRRRYDTLVRRARDVVETMTSCQFEIGDIALEIQPIQDHHGRDAGVYTALRMFADDIDVEFTTLLTYREVASKWPKSQRRTKAVWTVYRHLAHRDERFEVIKNPPYNEHTGDHRWSTNLAAHAAGHMPRDPISSEERVVKIHDLARDERVAAQVTADFLRRPDVAHRVASDRTARRAFFRAQTDRERQAADEVRKRVPAVKHIEHSMRFLHLVGYCQAFVAGINRSLPELRNHPLSDDEREVINHNLDRVQAAADFCRSAVATGDVGMDDQLSALLREEEP